MIKHGLENCLVPYERLFSDEIMDDILSGKRALMQSLLSLRSILSQRAKNKSRCGFYISETNYKPLFMLFSKNFNKKLKDKIDFRYVRISP